jgi:hypothetical protein
MTRYSTTISYYRESDKDPLVMTGQFSSFVVSETDCKTSEAAQTKTNACRFGNMPKAKVLDQELPGAVDGNIAKLGSGIYWEY